MSSHGGYRSKPGAGTTGPGVQRKSPSGVVGKGTLAEQAYAQRAQCSAPTKRSEAAAASDSTVRAAAAAGVDTPASSLPHAATVQQQFGHHDISDVQAHTGPDAAASARAMGSEAHATGNHVVLDDHADLHTVAHESAHVVQERGGVQLKDGGGAAGDAYEQNADAVADKVVRGESAEALLDPHAAPGGGTRAAQRKERQDDAILDRQAHLKNTDIEIPALEGALLATRLEAVKKGLLSRSAFDASLDLSSAMTQLQPAATADKGPVDVGAQVIAINAAQRLYLSLQRDTVDDKNYQPQLRSGPPSGLGPPASVAEQNPYTGESRVVHAFGSTHFDGPLKQLPAQIHDRKWDLAFPNYRELMNGLDRWVADQLRAQGKDTPDSSRANMHEQYAQHVTGLEKIADKHATRLPALFHPDPETVAKEKAAGRSVSDTIPMNVYFWKDDKTGKVHIYDLTTPGHPQEQTLDGPPSAATMNTFFEEVARYPEGEVRYTLHDGARGTSPTSGKVKWYEWAAYAGLILAGIGLTVVGGIGVRLLAEGASVIATACFATGTLAGGVSAAGHLVDSARLGTATTATVVLDVAQIAASFANFGATRLLVRAGSVSDALASSRYFVLGAAVADSVQLVALTEVTFAEMSQIQGSTGTPEDKQRAMSVLLTQLIVTGALTALSVQGARNAHALAGKPLEVVEQNGVPVARVAGEEFPPSAGHAESVGTTKGEEQSGTRVDHSSGELHGDLAAPQKDELLKHQPETEHEQHAGGPKKETSANEQKAAEQEAAGEKTASEVAALEKAEKEAQVVARSAAGNAEKNATKKYVFNAVEMAVVENKTRTAAGEAAHRAYKEATIVGATFAQANTAANKAAKEAAERVAKAEAEAVAKAGAERAIDSGGVFDLSNISPKTRGQLTEFNAAKTGTEAKRLAKELDGLSEKEFLAKLTGEPCTKKTVNIGGPPPQIMHVYEYPEGTVIRYKPHGSPQRPGANYSIEVKKDPAVPDLGKDDAVFKVDATGRAVPKGPFEIRNPYPKGGLQAVRFEREVMDAGHKMLN